MKKSYCAFYILLALQSLFLSQKAIAQSGDVGIGTTNPDPSSALEIVSTTKGLLIPRMVEKDRDNIFAPALGLLIYQTDGTPGFYYYSNGWQQLGSGVGGSGGANLALSNLQSTTAINANLIPNSSAMYNLGSPSLSWNDIHYFGDITHQGSRFISRRGTNLFLGNLAGNSATTGNYNTAFGNSALTANIGGTWNTAIGYEALNNTNNSYSNTGIGYRSLIANTSGTDNTGVGVLALSANNTGSGNSAHGVGSLQNAIGSYNTGLGYSSGVSLSSGDHNTFIGAFTNSPSGALSNATAIGYQASVTASNTVRIGNSSVSSIGGNVGWSTLSDGRFKKNVKENVPGLQFINQLRPVTYSIDVETLDKTLHPVSSKAKTKLGGVINKSTIGAEELKAKQDKEAITYTGFIAQEVETTAKKLGYNFSGVDAPKNNNDLYGLRYAEFVVPLVKAVQELNQKVETLQTEKSSLEKNNQATAGIIAKQQVQITSQQKEIDEMKALLTDMKKQIQTLTHPINE